MRIKVPNVSFSKHDQLKSELQHIFPDSQFNEEGKRYKGQELVDYLKDADGAIVGLEIINDTVLESCPNIKIISKYGVGLDSIDQDACKKRNVAIGWTGGVNRRSVSEMTLGFILMLLRNLYVTSNLLKQGNWKKNGGVELSGKTVGIIGVGNIGKDLVKLLAPFDCQILVNDIIHQEKYYQENGLTPVSKDYIYEHADIITVHTPLTADTKYLFDESSFEKMKKAPILINTARGGIINEKALHVALEAGIISGAAIDVYENEPFEDEILLQRPNLINTPHIGGNSKEAVLAMGRSAIKHLVNFFEK